MKSNRLVLALCSVSALLAAGNLSAQNLTEFKSFPGSKVRVDGTGNHPWTVEGKSSLAIWRWIQDLSATRRKVPQAARSMRKWMRRFPCAPSRAARASWIT